MGRKADPSRAHFKKVCVAVEGAAKQKISWDCNHCGFKMKYTRFPAAQGRIHLAADRGLIKSLWNKPCTADDEDAATRQAKFRRLENAARSGSKKRRREHQEQQTILDTDSERARAQAQDADRTSKKRKAKQQTMEQSTKVLGVRFPPCSAVRHAT